MPSRPLRTHRGGDSHTRSSEKMLVPHLPRSLPPGKQWTAIESVLEGALSAVRPDLAVKRAVRLHRGDLVVDGVRYPLDGLGRIRVLGVGKASSAMVLPLWELLGARLDGCMVIGKRGEQSEIFGGDSVEFLDGAHPIPDRDSVAAARHAMEFVAPLGPDDLLMVAISGGTSSLLTLPAPGLGLEAISETTRVLLRAGAAIQELNTVRKHLSRIKGGRLAQRTAPASLVNLILSDVMGDSLSAIGSGPTVPNDSTFDDACGVLAKYRVESQLPAEVLAHLTTGAGKERAATPSPPTPHLPRIQNVVVGSNSTAVRAAVEVARSLGFHTESHDGVLKGEARTVGARIANTIRGSLQGRSLSDGPACWVYGGETTVAVTGNGKGGRNQELALAAGIALDGVKSVTLVAFATDGIDGPTDAAGALVTGSTLGWAKRLGMDAQSFLDNNDAYTLFDGLGDLLRTGPTGTNVADLVLVFLWPQETPEPGSGIEELCY